MFERFVMQARQVIVSAQQEARDLAHDHIGTEHLLLGLLREPDGLAARVLGALGVTEHGARESVIRIVERGETASQGQIPFTSRATAALTAADAERRALGHWEIETEHILLGLLHADEGTALRILGDAGLQRERVRAEILRTLEANPARHSVSRPVAVENEQPQREWEVRPQIEVISADQAASFAVFRRPQRDSDRVPEDRAQAVQGGRMGTRGLNVALARRVSTPAGDVWVIPGNGHIGLIVPGGATCNPTEHAATRGIVSWGSTSSPGHSIVHGLLPDGVDEITLITHDGRSTTVPVRDNVYGATLQRAFRGARFQGPNGAIEYGPWS